MHLFIIIYIVCMCVRVCVCVCVFEQRFSLSSGNKYRLNNIRNYVHTTTWWAELPAAARSLTDHKH